MGPRGVRIVGTVVNALAVLVIGIFLRHELLFWLITIVLPVTVIWTSIWLKPRPPG